VTVVEETQIRLTDIQLLYKSWMLSSSVFC